MRELPRRACAGAAWGDLFAAARAAVAADRQKAQRRSADAIAKLERVLAAIGDGTPPGWTAEREERLIRDIEEAPAKLMQLRKLLRG